MNWLLGNRDIKNNESEQNTTPDADELRRRRLAKLEEEAAEAARRKEFEERKAKWQASKRAAAASDATSASDVSSLKGEDAQQSSIRQEPSSTFKQADNNHLAPSIVPTSPPSFTQVDQPKPKRIAYIPTVEEMVSRALARILGIALDASLASSELTFCEDLIEQLREDENLTNGQPLLLASDSHLDDILLNRIPNHPAPFEYLFACFERCGQQRSEVNSNKRLQGNQQDACRSTIHRAISDVEQRVLTYTGMLLTGAFMEVDNASPQAFAKLLVEDAVPGGFIRCLLNRHSLPDSSLDDILPGFKTVYMYIRAAAERDVKLSSSSFLKPLNALKALVSHKELCKVITADVTFCPKIDGNSSTVLQEFAQTSYLYPFFKISALPGYPVGTSVPMFPEEPSVATSTFPNPSILNRSEVENAIYSLRSALSLARNVLFQICLTLCKAGLESRDATLSWIGTVLNLNKKRTGMQPDPRITSRDGFMMNIMFVLLKLCEPIVSGGWKMLQKVDPIYPQSSHRIDYSDETRLAADTNMLKRWWVDQRNENAQGSLVRQLEIAARESGMASSSASGSDGSASNAVIAIEAPKEFSFVTECFWMALRAIQLGFSTVSQFYEQDVLRVLQRLGDIIKDLESAKENGLLEGNQEHQLGIFKVKFDILLQAKFCYDVYLMDKEVLALLVQFVTSVAEWIMKKLLVDSKGEASLPLPVPVDPMFASLPEHSVEIITTVLLTTMHADQSIVMDHSALLEDLVSFCVIGSASPLHIKNPYLRSKLVEFLSIIFPRNEAMVDIEEDERLPATNPLMMTLFSGHRLSRKFLPGALFRLYVDVEHTGSHTQFYDKFSIRYRIGAILESLWYMPDYRKSVRSEARDESRFLRFVNMVLNDAIHLMDSVLDDLEEMHSLEVLIERKGSEWEVLSDEEKQEKMDRLQRLESSAKNYNLIANNNVKLLWLLTEDDVVRRIFLRDEMVSRLAEMLNYLLERLCGQRCNDLKVSNPAKVSWKPRQLLKRIIGTFIHFKSEEKFSTAVAKDGRSYKPELFTRAIGIAMRRRLLPHTDIQSFEEIAAAAARAHDKENREEEDLGDIPDEFLDPIMSVLMKDPVRLPTSGNVMDRAVIQRILLSDKADPFNREFLTEDMLVDEVDLKKQIDAFVSEKRAARTARGQGSKDESS